MLVKIKLVHEDAQLPEYETVGSAGADARIMLPSERLRINAGETILLPTGLKMQVPEGWEVQVRPRSSMALSGIVVANSPGTIDSDFRGEVKLMLRNTNDYPVFVEHKQRVAQFILKEVVQADFLEVIELSETQRGEGGFGSTGRT